MGTRIEEDRHGEMYDPEFDFEFGGEGRWGVYPDWVPPAFDDDFSVRGLENLLRVAEANGVEVEGDAIEALEVEEAYVGEIDWVVAFEMVGEEIERELSAM